MVALKIGKPLKIMANLSKAKSLQCVRVLIWTPYPKLSRKPFAVDIDDRIFHIRIQEEEVEEESLFGEVDFSSDANEEDCKIPSDDTPSEVPEIMAGGCAGDEKGESVHGDSDSDININLELRHGNNFQMGEGILDHSTTQLGFVGIKVGPTQNMGRENMVADFNLESRGDFPDFRPSESSISAHRGNNHNQKRERKSSKTSLVEKNKMRKSLSDDREKSVSMDTCEESQEKSKNVSNDDSPIRLPASIVAVKKMARSKNYPGQY